MSASLFKPNRTVLVVVDVQEKLLPAMADAEGLFQRLGVLIRGLDAMDVPILWCEQTPEKIGPTVEPLRSLLGGEPIVKTTFSCWDNPLFREGLTEMGRQSVVLAGIETHICVQQTAAELCDNGYHVQVPFDTTSSRTPENKSIGLERIRGVGAAITCLEAILFELLRDSAHPAFREILKMIK